MFHHSPFMSHDASVPYLSHDFEIEPPRAGDEWALCFGGFNGVRRRWQRIVVYSVSEQGTVVPVREWPSGSGWTKADWERMVRNGEAVLLKRAKETDEAVKSK